MLLAAFEDTSLYQITVITLTNTSDVVLIENSESTMSETETSPGQNVFDSIRDETDPEKVVSRPRPVSRTTTLLFTLCSAHLAAWRTAFEAPCISE